MYACKIYNNIKTVISSFIDNFLKYTRKTPFVETEDICELISPDIKITRIIQKVKRQIWIT